MEHNCADSEEFADHRELVSGEFGQRRPGILDHREVARMDLQLRSRDHFHQYPASIVLILQATHEPGSLQPVDHEGDCPRREPGRVGQRSGGHRLVPVENLDAPEIGSVEPELVGNSLIEDIDGRLVGPHRFDQVWVPRTCCRAWLTGYLCLELGLVQLG